VLVDAQWDGPLLRSLGAAPMARERYLTLLDRTAGPLPLPTERLPAERLLPAPRA
jgi:leucyl/phenylalanyl-tRNA--protein transferase